MNIYNPQRTDESTILNTPSVEYVYKQLNAENQALARAAVTSFVNIYGASNPRAFQAYLTELLSNQLTQSHNESREDSALDREVASLLRNGINPDLNGVSGDSSGVSSEPQPSPLDYQSQGTAGSSSDGFGAFDRLIRFGAGLLNLVRSGQAAASAVGSTFGDVLSSAVSEIPGLLDQFDSGDIDDAGLRSSVLDVLFGDGIKPGKYQLKNGRALLDARSYAGEYIDSYMRGDKFQTNRASASAGLSSARQSARKAAFDDAVNEKSGINEIGGRFFRIEVDALKSVKRLEIKTNKLRAKADALKAEYERDFNASLDADLASLAVNKQNQASIDEAELRSDIANSTDGSQIGIANTNKAVADADLARSQANRSEISEERERRLNDYEKLEDDIKRIEYRSDEILADAELKMLDAFTTLSNYESLHPYSPFEDRYVRDTRYELSRRHSEAKYRYQDLLKSLESRSRRFSVRTPVVGFSYSE